MFLKVYHMRRDGYRIGQIKTVTIYHLYCTSYIFLLFALNLLLFSWMFYDILCLLLVLLGSTVVSLQWDPDKSSEEPSSWVRILIRNNCSWDEGSNISAGGPIQCLIIVLQV